jgi:hypothetical protein
LKTTQHTFFQKHLHLCGRDTQSTPQEAIVVQQQNQPSGQEVGTNLLFPNLPLGFQIRGFAHALNGTLQTTGTNDKAEDTDGETRATGFEEVLEVAGLLPEVVGVGRQVRREVSVQDGGEVGEETFTEQTPEVLVLESGETS